MTGLQLMIPPFVACMVLVAMLSYLGLHVIAREVIFVDLSLVPMSARGGGSAGVEDQRVGLPVLSLVRRRHHARGARGGGVDGLQLPRRAGGGRVLIYARHAAARLYLVGLGRSCLHPWPVDLARGRPADRPADRLHVRAGAGRRAGAAEASARIRVSDGGPNQ